MKHIKVLDLNGTIQIVGHSLEICLENVKGTIIGNVNVCDEHELFAVAFTAQLSHKNPSGSTPF